MNNLTRRPLGINEKVFWVIDQKVAMHFALVAELKGNEPEEAWRRAIDIAQRRHPNLSVKITGSHYSNLRFEQVANCPIPLTVIHQKEDDNWESIVEEELQKPLDLNNAPLARAVLLQQPGQSTFIFISNHSIGDGISGALVIRDILSALSGAVLTVFPHTPSLDELAGLPMSKVSDQTAPILDEEVTMLTGGVPWPGIKVERLELSSETTYKLIKRAKIEHTTVHSVITAAIILAGRALNHEWNDREVGVVHPLSPRKFYQAEEEYAMLVNLITIGYDTKSGHQIWDFARTISVSIAEAKTQEWQEGALSSVGTLFNLDLDLETIYEQILLATKSDMMVTNIGKLDFQNDFGSIELKSIWGPMVITPHQASHTIGVNTFDGRLRLTISSAKFITGLSKMVEKIIVAACE